MSDTGSGAGSHDGPPNPFSREGASSADAFGPTPPATAPSAPAQDSWPTYPAAPLPPPGFDPEPVPPYRPTSGYETAPVDGGRTHHRPGVPGFLRLGHDNSGDSREW